MGNCIDECIVLLVPANLTNEKGCIQDDTANDNGKQEDAEKQQNSGVPIKKYPANVEEESKDNEADAESDEKRNRLSSARYHHAIQLKPDILRSLRK